MTKHLALAIVLFGGSARADKAAADAAFAEAKRLVAAGKLAEACPKFEVSYNEDPQVGSLLNLADCHERTDKLATARAEFHSAVELAHLHKDARESYARTRAAALDGRVAHVILHKRPDADAGLVIKLDDRDVTAMLESDLPIDAGHHVIAATTASGTWSSALEIEADGVHHEVTVPGKLEPLPVAPAPTLNQPPPITATPSAPPPPPTIERVDASARTRRHLIAAGLAGGGVVIVGAGLFFGKRAFSDYDDRASACTTSSDQNCIPDQITAARNAATTSDILCGVGGAAIAAAAIVWFTAPAERFVVTPIAGGGTVGGSITIRY